MIVADITPYGKSRAPPITIPLSPFSPFLSNKEKKTELNREQRL